MKWLTGMLVPLTVVLAVFAAVVGKLEVYAHGQDALPDRL